MVRMFRFSHFTPKGKILFAGGGFLCALFLGYISVRAQATANTDTVSALQRAIQEIEIQIAVLQVRLNEAQSALQRAKETAAVPVPATERARESIQSALFTRSLSIGTRGDDVRELQKFLSQFPDLYPEKLQTGFYGPLTATAVRKFQERHGIETVGTVGPKTLVRIHELLAKGAGASGVVPPGLITAPGIQKKLATTASELSSTATSTPFLISATTAFGTPTTTAATATTTTAATTASTTETSIQTTQQTETQTYLTTASSGNSGSSTAAATTTTSTVGATTATTSSTGGTTSTSATTTQTTTFVGSSLTAPTSIRADWSYGWNNTRDNTMGQQIIFQYPTDNNSKTTAFRFYKKAPGDASFSLAGEFHGFDSTSCTANGTRVYVGAWGLIGAPWTSCGTWAVTKNPVAASEYAPGEYSYYVAAVDAAGREGAPSAITKQIFFEPITILAPTAAQSPIFDALTFQWTVGSGWPANVAGQAPLLFTIAIFDSATAINPLWTTNVDAITSPGTNSKIYNGPALDPSKRYRLTIYGWGSQSGNGPSYMALPSAVTDFWINAIPIAVIYPNGGETVDLYHYNYTFRSALRGVSRIGLKILKGSQTVYTSSNPITTAEFSFNLDPQAYAASVGSGSDYKIRVYGWDHPEVYDDSDNTFTIPAPTPQSSACISDTDRSLNYGVKGSVTFESGTYFDQYGGGQLTTSGGTLIDACVDRNVIGAGVNLKEVYCDGDSTAPGWPGNAFLKIAYVDCAYGCSDGACNASPTARIFRDLTLGSIGNDVRELQTFLVGAVGYPADLITGYFGRITRDALKQLQEKYDVEPASGYFGEKTKKTLNEILIKKQTSN